MGPKPLGEEFVGRIRNVIKGNLFFICEIHLKRVSNKLLNNAFKLRVHITS